MLTSVWLVVWSTVALGQFPPAPPPAGPSGLPAQYQVADSTPAMDEILARLNRTEAALQALQAQQMQAGGIPSPPDEMQEDAAAAELYDAAFVDPKDEKSDAKKDEAKKEEKKDDKPKEKKWYDKLSLRGYAQFRLAESVNERPGSAPPQLVLDRSASEDQTILLRRARVTLSGDVSDYVHVYCQTEFANNVPGVSDAIHFSQIRDWYADCYFDKTKVHRLRIGQSKVPYGWETLQSSSNRVPLERSESFNTAVRNERELGVFYYWTPEDAQKFFKEMTDTGLKGSGNYGVFGVGVYNGQGGSFAEQNDSMHLAARLTIPYQLDNCQCFEVGLQGYTGMFTVLGSAISPLGVGPASTPAGTINFNREGLLDRRIGSSFIWYPQPFGFQCEWNWGEGPGLNDAQDEVVVRPLNGGYVMMMYKYDSDCYGTFFPFARYNRYEGGYKSERNAPYATIDETEFGVEWQFNKQTELVLGYTVTNRTNTTAISAANTLSYEQFVGDIIRCQFQVNY